MAVINGTKLSDFLIGTADSDISGFSDAISGLDGNDTLFGLEGDDRLDGGSGADLMDGGQGDDIYIVDNIGDLVRESGTDLEDEIVTSMSYSLAALPSIEFLTLLGKAAISGSGNSSDNRIFGNLAANKLFGSAGNDTIFGGKGDDTLDGGTGKDHMTGGAGNDTYLVDNASDVVSDTEFGATPDGIDTVISSVAFKLGSTIENLILVNENSTSALEIQSGFGNELNNRIIGSGAHNNLVGGLGKDTLEGRGGADTLDGSGGDDLLIGGEGGDVYLVEAGDRIQESIAGAEGGIDFVSYIGEGAFVLGANLEDLEVTNALLAIGNALDNKLFSSNPFGTELRGLAGDDDLRIDVTIDGCTLDGGAGADFMRGGNGNDLFIVDNGADRVEGLAGIDEIRTSLSVLQEVADVENYTFTGGAVSFSTDSSLANNKLTGTKFADFLSSNVGNDTLLGGAGNDTIFGGVGSDLLDGGVGADSMTGGSGSDHYIVDNAKDVVNESSAGDDGADLVSSSISFDLGGPTVSGNVEFLDLTGGAAISGTGNGLDNSVIGNAAANKLSGGAGADTLNGEAGNDILSGDTGADFLTGNLGNDTLTVDELDVASGGDGIDTLIATGTVNYLGNTDIENFVLATGAGAISLTAGEIANKITGNEGANNISARNGNDTVDGGLGNDTIDGGIGDDILTGGGGDDLIIGGFGNNKINVAMGNDTVQSGLIGINAHDLISGFDGNAAGGGQDLVSLAALFDSLGIAAGDRLAHVDVKDKGSTVEIRIDTSTAPGGDGTFDLLVATLQTSDVIVKGEDVLV